MHACLRFRGLVLSVWVDCGNLRNLAGILLRSLDWNSLASQSCNSETHPCTHLPRFNHRKGASSSFSSVRERKKSRPPSNERLNVSFRRRRHPHPPSSSLPYRMVQLNLIRKLKYFTCCLIDLFLFLAWHLSNSIWNTSISGVNSSWTSLYFLPRSHLLGWTMSKWNGTEKKEKRREGKGQSTFCRSGHLEIISRQSWNLSIQPSSPNKLWRRVMVHSGKECERFREFVSPILRQVLG